MRDFRDSLFGTMHGALIAQAHLLNFQIEDEAAFFFVNRALEHIYRNSTSNRSRFDAAVVAMMSAPVFLRRIQRETEGRRAFLTENAARNVIGSLTYDCFYPWCSDIEP
jgi:hypothetical protein